MKEYIVIFGPRNVFIEDEKLFYQRNGRSKTELIPLREDLFILKEVDDFRIEFIRDDSMQINKLKGLYKSGHSDVNLLIE